MPFSVVVTSTEHYWVTLAEHRSPWTDTVALPKGEKLF
jgi:hypothetical protein